MSRSFDAIVVGAGQAGPSLAVRLAQAGQRVAIVERKLLGGTCVNAGCTPTKTLIASAHAAHLARRGADFGVTFEGSVGVDMTRVKARQAEVVGNSRANLEAWIRAQKNLTLLEGHARFESATEIRVGDMLLSAPQIFLDVGARPNVPDMPGIGGAPILTSSSLLAMTELPGRLVIVGGSYVGLEFAQMYRRFGAEVTVVEMAPRLIGREDPEISEAVAAILRAEGIELRLGAECIAFARIGDEVCVHVSCTEGDPQVMGSHVLLAIGRAPNTHDLGLEKAGVATDGRGYIGVDESLRTNVPGIWALGDCNGRGAFTHTAYNDFEIVAANLLNGEARKVTDRISAYALYIDPPLGRVGMNEAQARATGRQVLVGVRPMSRVARAVEKGETQGLMKLMVDAQSRHILGAAILGVGGDEAIHSILDCMYAQAPYTVLQRAVHIHPTVSELIPTLLGELKPLI